MFHSEKNLVQRILVINKLGVGYRYLTTLPILKACRKFYNITKTLSKKLSLPSCLNYKKIGCWYLNLKQ